MRRWTFAGVVVGLVLSLLLWPAWEQAGGWRQGAAVRSAADGCPEVPNTPRFTIAYGTVRVDGADAPVGTTVHAVSPRGNVVGCFEVTTVGHYGAMYIYGEDTSANPPIAGMRDGETVAFRVSGVEATASLSLVWHDDKAPHQVDLSAATPPPGTDTPTPSSGPDLVVENLEVSPLSPALNQSIVVTATIRNQGGADVSQFFYTDAYADRMPSGCNDVGWAYQRTDRLTSGDVTVLTFTHSGFDTTGVHTFYAQVDSACQVDESDEGNNIFGPLRIQVTDATPTPTPPPTPTSTPTPTPTPTSTPTPVPSPPQADFTASPRSGATPLTVQFTDLSTGQIDTWLWEFGDGVTSSLQNPTHTYTLTGTFTVSLTVAGIGGRNVEARQAYITTWDQFDIFLPLMLKQ